MIWSSLAATGATLTGINAIINGFRREYRNLFIHGLLAVSIVAMAAIELLMMRSEDPDLFGRLHRWYHLALWGCFMAMALLGPRYIKWGSMHVLIAACAIRTVSLVLNFLSPVSLNYLEITAIRKIRFLGDQVSIPVGVINDWMIVGQLGYVLALLYIVQGLVRGWRRDEAAWSSIMRLFIGFMLMLGLVHLYMVYWQGAEVPIAGSAFFAVTFFAMAVQLFYHGVESRRLGDELRQREHELARMNRISSVGLLAASITHEVNQPLATSLSTAEALERCLDREQPDLQRARTFARELIRQSERAGDIINGLRRLINREAPNNVIVNLHDVIEGVLAFMQGEFDRREIRHEKRLNHPSPLIKGDRKQLQQVLLNLLLNAFKAIGEAPQKRREVIVETRLPASGLIAFSIADRGPGIPEEQLPKLFEPFFSNHEQGIGMGLAICKMIVTRHGGTITAENRPGGGAVFHVTLPLFTHS